MKATDIYCQAIKRTFAQLYGAPPSMVDVTWSNESDTIAVSCAGKTFIHLILSGTDDHSPEFHCISEDPVVVTLSEDERNQLERAI